MRLQLHRAIVLPGRRETTIEREGNIKLGMAPATVSDRIDSYFQGIADDVSGDVDVQARCRNASPSMTARQRLDSYSDFPKHTVMSVALVRQGCSLSVVQISNRGTTHA